MREKFQVMLEIGGGFRFPRARQGNTQATADLLARLAPDMCQTRRAMSAQVLRWFWSNDYWWFRVAQSSDPVGFDEVCLSGCRPKPINKGSEVLGGVQRKIDMFRRLFSEVAVGLLSVVHAALPFDNGPDIVFRGLCFAAPRFIDDFVVEMCREGPVTPASYSTDLGVALGYANPGAPKNTLISGHLAKAGYTREPENLGLLCVMEGYCPLHIQLLKGAAPQ